MGRLDALPYLAEAAFCRCFNAGLMRLPFRKNKRGRPLRTVPLEWERAGYFLGAVIIGKSSVRKGEAGRPFLFQRFTNGKSLQP